MAGRSLREVEQPRPADPWSRSLVTGTSGPHSKLTPMLRDLGIEFISRSHAGLRRL